MEAEQEKGAGQSANSGDKERQAGIELAGLGYDDRAPETVVDVDDV